jgi:hypothetical protein
MERKRAWIAAGTIGVTFATAALAVMANTGLLSVASKDRSVGRLVPTDITVETSPVGDTTAASADASAATDVIVRYEDVYDTVPASDSAVADSPVPAATVAPRARTKNGKVTNPAKTTQPGTAGKPGTIRAKSSTDSQPVQGDADDD